MASDKCCRNDLLLLVIIQSSAKKFLSEPGSVANGQSLGLRGVSWGRLAPGRAPPLVRHSSEEHLRTHHTSPHSQKRMLFVQRGVGGSRLFASLVFSVVVVG